MCMGKVPRRKLDVLYYAQHVICLLAGNCVVFFPTLHIVVVHVVIRRLLVVLETWITQALTVVIGVNEPDLST